MGISVISLIEIVYFLGIRVRHFYVQQQKNRVAQMSKATRDVVQVLQLAKEPRTVATTTPDTATAWAEGGNGGGGQQRVVMMTRPTACGGRATKKRF